MSDKQETRETWQRKSHTRDEKLRTALCNGGGDMAFLATSMIHAALEPLYQSGHMSDLTVTCRGQQFRVHKAIVCSQSPFFDKACNSGFQEGIEQNVDLPEENPEILDRFFQFLYAGTYSDGEHLDCLPSKPAMMSPAAVSASLAAATLGPVQESGLERASILSNTTTPPGNAANGDASHESVTSADQAQSDEEGDDEYSTTEESDTDGDDSEMEVTEGSDTNGDISEMEVDPLDYDSEVSEHTDPNCLRELYNKETNKGKLPPGTANCQDNILVASIIISLKVYVMAEKYDVPALKLLAEKRFRGTVENFWLVYDGLPAMADELFASTLPQDPLRTFIVELVASQYLLNPAIRVKMRPVMERHTDFAMGVLDQLASSGCR